MRCYQEWLWCKSVRSFLSHVLCCIPAAIISKLSVKLTRVEQHYARGCCGESKEREATELSGLAPAAEGRTWMR